MFVRRKLFRRLIELELLSRPLTDVEEKKIFELINSLKTSNQIYNDGLEDIKRAFIGHFSMKEFIGRNVTIDETETLIDNSLYVLRVDVPVDKRYREEEQECYNAMEDALLSVKEMLEELE